MIIIELPPKNSNKREILRFNFKRILLFFIVLLILPVIIYFISKPNTLAAIFQKKEIETATNSADTDVSGIIIADVEESETEIKSEVIEPKLKHNDYLTSVLLVGIDSRIVTFENGQFTSKNYNNSSNGSRNTDTIIQIVYDNLNENVFMISIPRDMGVDVREDCLSYHASIHAVYDRAQAKNCPGGGVEVLKKTVENITGIEIQYYAFVTLEGFKQVIDTVGEKNDQGKTGVKINNPSAYSDIYPREDGRGYEKVFFPKGEIFLNSSEALKFVRSRQASSDFSRVRRQQLFLMSLKDAALSSKVLLNPQKVLHLIQIFSQQTIFTTPSLEEIRGGIEILQNFNKITIYNLYLDPDFGGKEVYLDKQPNGRTGGWYYMTPTAWKSCPGDEFCKVKAYIRNITIFPKVYQENAIIYAYSTSGSSNKPNFGNTQYQELKDSNYPFQLREGKTIVNNEFADSVTILDFSNGTKPETIALLKEKLNAQVLPGGKAPNVQKNKEDIAIIITPNQ